MTDIKPLLVDIIAQNPGLHAMLLRREILQKTGENVSYSLLYAALAVLEKNKLIYNWIEPGGPERGGYEKVCWATVKNKS